MIRWSDIAWGICYADDNVRGIMGTLYRVYTGGGNRHLDNACDILRFLANTTGSHGIRPSRTNNTHYDDNEKAVFNITQHPERR